MSQIKIQSIQTISLTRNTNEIGTIAEKPQNPRKEIQSEIPAELREAKQVLLWVERDFDSVDKTGKILKQHLPKLEIIKVSSSAEAGIWLSTFGQQLSTKLLVMTNRYREEDGKDKAWERVVEKVRELQLNTTTVIVFCGSQRVEEVKQNAKLWNRVIVTEDPAVILSELQKIAH